ncbi:V-type ATP synthase subunit F [Acidaminobacter sp.]|uniref:V-type ATP synthase subunit F n=1 Tax=Acidaminobacter sp. TaxID=1872102 RepID=UPI00137E0847|nr:V-type ATP synthase subunit F [Acidaminobacter sp.]MDK9710358.1 V-type ATP synthase subunit F [Acidaminobacter sp.]MZQ97917.1 V-type ATP synthase subunit F [Acidaminobacter sp.]
MLKLGVIGDYNTVLTFKTAGIHGVCPKGREEARRALADMSDGSYAVVFVTENFAGDLEDLLAAGQSKSIPAIILIPGQNGSQHLGLQRIKDNMEKAVGVNLL